ncbi:MAG: flagellar biosynthesis regulator FlaF [Alphaproteobacteria bacterium]|nr:flagellar biosynthesis regulator FlaF [Alphaproteobacteria bacterium]
MSNENVSTQYRQPTQQGGSPRETEGRALMEAARRLSIAKDNPSDITALVDTVRLNWRLWTIFQSDLSDPQTDLPADLRSNMLNLCNFIDKRTVDILSDPKPQSLDVLININRNIAAGLLSDTAAAKPASDSNTEEPRPPSLGVINA